MLQHAVNDAESWVSPYWSLRLRIDYPWACPRFHVLLSTEWPNKRVFERLKVAYYPMSNRPPRPAADWGSLGRQLRWSLQITNPAFQARMQEVVAERLVRMERVDDKACCHSSALSGPGRRYALRRYLQKQLPVHLGHAESDPLVNHGLPALSSLPEAVLSRWPMASEERLAGNLTGLPLQGPGVVEQSPGGSTLASRQWTAFLHSRLSRYPQDRNQVETRGTSGLSAALHFGHISSTQMVHELLAAEKWTPDQLGVPKGSRSGWWGLSEGQKLFDQTVTWREVGHIFCHHVPDFHCMNGSLLGPFRP